jgi:glyoxylase-like metal-dependent hydrolase (beta-lactamase superfamily II)
MKQIADGLWRVEGPELRMPGGVVMPLCSTMIRLPDRSLVIYSPIAFDAAAAASIDALGEVAHLIAPSRWHHLFVAAAVRRWPRAIVHGAPGLAAQRPELRIDKQLGDGEPAWRDALEVEVVRGVPKLSEAVVWHRPSGTLVCADLVFHITRPANLRTRLVLAMMGVGGGRLAQSRGWRWLRRSRADARRSIDRILDWPIGRVAPCHGPACEIDSRALGAVLARAYGGVPRRTLATEAVVPAR